MHTTESDGEPSRENDQRPVLDRDPPQRVKRLKDDGVTALILADHPQAVHRETEPREQDRKEHHHGTGRPRRPKILPRELRGVATDEPEHKRDPAVTAVQGRRVLYRIVLKSN